MLIPVRKADGLIYHELICDTCRKVIKPKDFEAATVDFSPIKQKDLKTADYEDLINASRVYHFHAGCAPQQCVGACWQKGDSVLYALAANVFHGTPVGKAAKEIRSTHPTPIDSPWGLI